MEEGAKQKAAAAAAAVAEVAVRLKQVKFVQPNLAVAEGHVIVVVQQQCPDDNDVDNGNQIDPVCTATANAPTGLGFVHDEPCHIFVRAPTDVLRLEKYIRDIGQEAGAGATTATATATTATSKGTGRWHRLATSKKENDSGDEEEAVILRLQTVLSRAIERNRRGIKLIECQEIVALMQQGQTTIATNTARLPAAMALAVSQDNSSTDIAAVFRMYDKSKRQELFAAWLLNTYGKDFLSDGSGVLDVAGGKGELSQALQQQGVPSVVLDPEPRLAPNNTNEGMQVPGSVPVIAHALEGDGSTLLLANDDENTTHASSKQTPSLREQQLILTCSMIVGMHPDQATEPILRLAQKLQVPFAVLPCCVMPSLFPHRIYQGQPVRSYRIFCLYLQSLLIGTCVKVEYLPFMGRNTILYTD